MIVQFLLLVLSFVILYYGAIGLVKGATNIALKLRLSRVVVGVILVAFGTSSPELVVNCIAGYKGHTGFALGNIAGSNLANICIGFGICAFLAKLYFPKREFY